MMHSSVVTNWRVRSFDRSYTKTDASETKHSHRAAGLYFGRTRGCSDSGSDAATKQANLLASAARRAHSL